jgi:hypothetical protein
VCTARSSPASASSRVAVRSAAPSAPGSAAAARTPGAVRCSIASRPPPAVARSTAAPTATAAQHVTSAGREPGSPTTAAPVQPTTVQAPKARCSRASVRVLGSPRHIRGELRTCARRPSRAPAGAAPSGRDGKASYRWTVTRASHHSTTSARTGSTWPTASRRAGDCRGAAASGSSQPGSTGHRGTPSRKHCQATRSTPTPQAATTRSAVSSRPATRTRAAPTVVEAPRSRRPGRAHTATLTRANGSRVSQSARCTQPRTPAAEEVSAPQE